MISNKYIIDIKPRSIWNNVETTLVPKEFFNKYLELINIISYIKDIWVIQEDGTASRYQRRRFQKKCKNIYEQDQAIW